MPVFCIAEMSRRHLFVSSVSRGARPRWTAICHVFTYLAYPRADFSPFARRAHRAGPGRSKDRTTTCNWLP